MKELFKGYIRTRGKKSIDPFKNKDASELLTLTQVQNTKEYAGVLADDIILIDIDDPEQADILFQIVEEQELLCRVYETTRGKHFLFKNTSIERCKTHSHIALSLEADIKLGTRNSYEVLKLSLIHI